MVRRGLFSRNIARKNAVKRIKKKKNGSVQVDSIIIHLIGLMIGCVGQHYLSKNDRLLGSLLTSTNISIN